jgi:NTP pyrophosphatase (non-canonical NTP hydrolase)
VNMEPRSELELRSLVELVAHLRSERGCPWDRAQTHESLKSLLIEEAYETVAAIESGESQALQDELGDLLLHVAFHVQIAQEQKEFTLHDVLLGIYEKVVRRHPHVFGTESPTDVEQIKGRWEEIKRQEGKRLSVTTALPALIEARKLQERAAQSKKEFSVRPSPAIAARLLATHWQPHRVPHAPITFDHLQARDIVLDLAAQLALHLIFRLDLLAQRRDLLLCEIPDLLAQIDAGLVQDPLRQRAPNPVDIRERNIHALVAWQIHSSNPRHISSLSSPGAACA